MWTKDGDLCKRYVVICSGGTRNCNCCAGLIQQHGIATSIYRSGQQWDFPNAWAPMQDMIVEGLQLYGGRAPAAPGAPPICFLGHATHACQTQRAHDLLLVGAATSSCLSEMAFPAKWYAQQAGKRGKIWDGVPPLGILVLLPHSERGRSVAIYRPCQLWPHSRWVLQFDAELLLMTASLMQSGCGLMSIPTYQMQVLWVRVCWRRHAPRPGGGGGGAPPWEVSSPSLAADLISSKKVAHCTPCSYCHSNLRVKTQAPTITTGSPTLADGIVP